MIKQTIMEKMKGERFLLFPSMREILKKLVIGILLIYAKNRVLSHKNIVDIISLIQ